MLVDTRNCEDVEYEPIDDALNNILYEEYQGLNKIVKWTSNLNFKLDSDVRSKIKAVAFYQLDLLRKVTAI